MPDALLCHNGAAFTDPLSITANNLLFCLYVLHVTIHFPESGPKLPFENDELRNIARFGNWVACSCTIKDKSGVFIRSCPNRWNFANGKQGLVRTVSGSIDKDCQAVRWYNRNGGSSDTWRTNIKAWYDSDPGSELKSEL